MIVDRTENILFYEKLLPNIAAGMEKVKELKTLEVGRYEFDGGYFMIQKGETKPMDEGTYEAHRNYIDVQIIVEGSEEMAWRPLCELTSVIPYNPEKDAERLDGPKDHVLWISEGMFYAAFPEDGHKPVSHTKKQQSFTKIVMKLPADIHSL